MLEVLPSVTLCRSLGREKHGGRGTPIFETASAVSDFIPLYHGWTIPFEPLSCAAFASIFARGPNAQGEPGSLTVEHDSRPNFAVTGSCPEFRFELSGRNRLILYFL